MLHHVAIWLAVLFALLAALLWISSTSLFATNQEITTLQDNTDRRFDVHMTTEKQSQLNRLVGYAFAFAAFATIFALLLPH